ncbi:MAG: hypothetical protein ACTSUO_03390 [Candidatus Thorarchaeota archaeon]
MSADKALANSCISSEIQGGGDTGRRRVEHRSFEKLGSLSIYEMLVIAIFKSQGQRLARMSRAETLSIEIL